MSTPPPARQLRSWSRHALALGLFVVAFSTLEIISYSRESATWDEPVHLLDGYRSLSGDFRVDVEHPPLLRMWAALPLLLTDLRWDRRLIDDASPFGWAIDGVFKAAHQFLYVDNDADRLLYRSRFMIVILGLMLGVLLYAWAQALYGWSAAATVLAIYTAEPNIASHARLVTTDFGVTLAIFGAVFFAWRTAVRWTIVNASGIVAFSAMAVLSKFSGLLLAPMLLLLLTVAVIRRRLTLRRAAAVSVATTIVALAAIWACYGFRYLPSDDPRWRYAFHTEPFAKHDLPVTTAVVRWIDGHRLLPNAYTEGFLLTQARAQRRKAYLSGEYSETGWWYYFYALAVKTPLALLVLAALGLWIVATRGDPNGWYLWIPCVVVMGVAMSATINLGVRHILPIFPFMVMLAGAAVERLRPRRAAVAAVLVMLAIAEPARAYPHTLAFFNVLVGGPDHGSEHLVDSNLDWGQDLKPLAGWMTEHRIDRINLAYFGLADPRYYGIDATFLPGSALWVPPGLIQLPRLPAYVAVSATLLRGVYGPTPAEREFYTRLAALTPIAIVGHSIYVFQVERPWWTPASVRR